LQSNSKSKIGMAIVLALSVFAAGCSAQWVSVALADLPVLTQMALNIASMVATLQSGQKLSPVEAAAVQNISAEASRDLALLQTFYNEYKANPDAHTMQKIENVIADINQNLPALLQAAHISDPTLAGRIAAGVNLILTTVSSFASLIPQTVTSPASQKTRRNIRIPSARDLKTQWNLQVCAPAGHPEIDAAVVGCELR
jgi:hypothetical protein